MPVKLLFDENLSPRLVTRLADVYAASAHVSSVNLVTAPDERIWEFAAANDFMIVTQDDDVRQRSFLQGSPPKAIWLRFGNCATDVIAAALRARIAAMQTFVADPGKALLILSRVH